MNKAQLNLVAVVGRQGFIGNSGERPMFEDKETAIYFRARFVELCSGGTVLVGGRTFASLMRHGFDPDKAPFSVAVWDRECQSRNSPEQVVEALSGLGNPLFLAGGRYTFECFMPWVEQMFLTRAMLTIGSDPLYMPELFQRTQ